MFCLIVIIFIILNLYKGSDSDLYPDNEIVIKSYAMMQNKKKTIIQRRNPESELCAGYAEKENRVEGKSGGLFHFRETSFDGL